MLMEDIEVQLVRPPVPIGPGSALDGMLHRAFCFRCHGFSFLRVESLSRVRLGKHGGDEWLLVSRDRLEARRACA